MVARLKRTLSLGSVVLFGIAYMTPIIVLGDFRHPRRDHPDVPAAYIAASLAMLFPPQLRAHGRGLPRGRLGLYVRKAIDSRLGFIAGWAVLSTTCSCRWRSG